MSFLDAIFGKKKETLGQITILKKNEYATAIITNKVKHLKMLNEIRATNSIQVEI